MWRDRRRELEPRFGRVCGELLASFVFLAAGILPFLAVRAGAAMLLVLPSAVWMGFWWHSLFLFFHEAAHRNLARDQRWNDRLANLLLLPFLGMDIASYRALHWRHHRDLGAQGDSEISYLNPITIGGALAELLGLNAMRSIGRYGRMSAGTGVGRPQPRVVRGLVVLATVQGAIIALLALRISPAAAGAWAAAGFFFMPLLNKTRQTLEHRSVRVPARPLSSPAEQGPLNRLFGSDLFSRSFGGAGFNRHLLHHWDPLVSYTRLPDMEAFFLGSVLAPAIERNRSTYLAMLRALSR